MKKGYPWIEMLVCQPTCHPKPWRRGKSLRRQARSAFTLVEMLVVIAILGILMAMMIPAAGMIMRRAANARAKSDADVVVATLMKYQMEYNRWPPMTAVSQNPDVYLTDKAWVDIMSPLPDAQRTVANFNKIVFFEPGGGALDENGAFVDSWGNPFRFSLDLTGSEEFANPDPDPDAKEPTTIHTKVIAWSMGSDRELDSEQAEDWDDNPKSWWK